MSDRVLFDYWLMEVELGFRVLSYLNRWNGPASHQLLLSDLRRWLDE